MTIAEAKIHLMEICENDESSSQLRCAIEALPDPARLNLLDSLVQALVYTRLYQLVTLEVVS